MTDTGGRIPNALIHESSPYLLQHAYNPVKWYPWGNEALDKAKSENKLLLISIGYSACHWCHVMEHESFENDEIAGIMNNGFICIKVDREERPDIDQVYMTAVQLMTGRGGWPLNCFALPDGRPVYGGTYFPMQQWKNILLNLEDLYTNDKNKFLEYAQELTHGISQYELIPPVAKHSEFSNDILNEAVRNWSEQLDRVEGGPARAPKFPLPNNYLFFLEHYFYSGDQPLLNHLRLTLKKMAYGGIYDQLGGGFARYSVDAVWKVPHFEKMLYDNSQLVSLYSEAFRLLKEPLYRDVVYQTLSFVERELTGVKGFFYSALDADSEGHEGLYYTWTRRQLMEILQKDYEIFADYYNVNETGYWEDNRYILLRKSDDEVVAGKFNLPVSTLRDKLNFMRQRLLEVREQRVRPGLDDKSLAGWNAMMASAYVDAYHAFGDEKFQGIASNNLQFISTEMTMEEGRLYRNFKNDKKTINAFLEDYAFLIDAYIKMYTATFEINWLNKANVLCAYANDHFSDEQHCFYYYTSDLDPPLIARKQEIHDNVIPASNSQMAINLYYLGHYFENHEYVNRSRRMVSSLKKHLVGFGSSYSNWLRVWRFHTEPLREVIICGNDALALKDQMMRTYFAPGTIIAGAISAENLPATHNRLVPGQNFIYVCTGKSCHLPVKSVPEALSLLD